ncbi:MAG: hypothetical protein JW927_07605 [Deltaproteobacteria bacterium]|nr:hypothetical protein [Deltaproteobacteria bacterium]
MVKIVNNIGKLTIYLIFSVLITWTTCFAKEEDESLSVFSEFGLEYSDNIFGVTEDQILILNENDPDDAASYRFRGMDSLTDYILKPRLGMKWYPNWGKLTLTAWLQYNYYIKNKDSGYPEGRVIIKYPINKKGSFIFRGSSIYDYTKKNYLSGFNDINGNGNIPRDERIYSSALYDEYEGQIGYRYVINDDKDRILSGVNIEPFTGYSVRSYNPIFDNRDKDTAFGGLSIELEFINTISLEGSYRYDDVSAPGNMEYILYDETESSVDINGDGEIRGNAPLYTAIDRSSERHFIEVNPSIKLTEDISISMGYSKLTTKYRSDNHLDTEHYLQTAYRKKYKSGVSYDLSDAWSLEAEYSKTKDDDPEDGSYEENSYMFTIKHKF